MSAEQQTRGAWPGGQWRWVALGGVVLLFGLSSLDLFQHYTVGSGGLTSMLGFNLDPGPWVLGLGFARGVSLALAWSKPRAGFQLALVVTAVTAALSDAVSTSEPWPWAATAVFGYAALLAIAGARGMARRELVRWWIAAQVLSVVVYVPVWALGTANFASGIVMAVVSAAGAVLGGLLWSRSEARSRLAEQEVISETERSERARLQERARIARELHDVVAHHLSVVVVRADSAPHRLPAVSDEVQQEFAEIGEAARASLTEMRRVLRLLREDAPQELEPQPGFDQLPELISSARQAGAVVELDVEALEGIDPAVQLTVYRVVQEALSNAVRHAPRSAVKVLVRRAYGCLRVDVVNGPGAAAAPATGSGHGLRGMRERVELVDGTIMTGPTEDGGYQVYVEIPVGEEVTGDDSRAGR
ncbi:sensor histidine kinase [Kribbella antibiotica]|uniref:histidine kinase n=1 Tax=Kribbella antibiotica TaxID=190195 RepID=A0A4V2YPU5_9ACTN|nr:histidine kinase [Kribbella antibiotica]TDD59547.1 sensor histidine kinase [Kribbella antibiotica]